jgi:hypothetical protein
MYGSGLYGNGLYSSGELAITDVLLGGIPLDLDAVLADVTIRHGRTGAYDAAQASTAQLTILGATRALAARFTVGVRLALDAVTPRFTGVVSDAQLDDDRLTVLGVGNLAAKGRRELPAAWTAPAESWSARAARVMGLANLAPSDYLVVADPDFNPTVAAVDGTQDVAHLVDELNTLADDVGALVCDLPDGRLFVQAMGARTVSGALVIDPAHVLYAPPWVQTDEVYNDVTVKYVGGAAETSDAGSMAIFDHRPRDITTQLVNGGDANLRAAELLSRTAYARWYMPACPLIRGYPLALGGPVSIAALPPASPASTWTSIVEGWTDTVTGADWAMDVSLSDPVSSGVTLAWQDVPAADLWNTISQTVVWKDALTLAALEG